jgi:hypothetical protein
LRGVPAATKKIAKIVAKDLPPVAAAVEVTVKELAGGAPVKLDPDEIEESVCDTVKQSVQRVVREMIEEEAWVKENDCI